MTRTPQTRRLGLDQFGLEERSLMTTGLTAALGPTAPTTLIAETRVDPSNLIDVSGKTAVVGATADTATTSRTIESVVTIRNPTPDRLTYQIQFGTATWRTVTLQPGQAIFHRAAGPNRVGVIQFDASTATGYQGVRLTVLSKNFVTGGAEGWAPRYTFDGMIHNFQRNTAATGWNLYRVGGLDTTRYAAVRAQVQGFENLGTNYEVLGPSTGSSSTPGSYNCISWTLGRVNGWTFPSIQTAADIRYWDALYGAQGYQRLSTLDFRLQTGIQKVVLYYGSNNGVPGFTHAARQETDGNWSSKLGGTPLIKHATPYQVAGAAYGQPAFVYARAAV